MAKSPDSSNPTPAGSSAVKRGLFSRKPKEAKAKKPSRLKQIREVFTMTRRHDPMVPWLMLLVFLGVVAVSFLVGYWLDNWITEEQPVAVNPRTQDAVFRAIGRPGVVLVSEGPTHRVKPLLDAERKRLARILPNVTVHVIESGRGEGQVPISEVAKKMGKLKKELTKLEVNAVSKRIASLGNRLPIPKGIDPYKARPNRGR